MPQSERSHNVIDLLKWLAKQNDGATVGQIHAYVTNEVTVFGATEKAIDSYIEVVSNAMFIEYQHPRWLITKAGRDWLERHTH